MEKMDVCHIMHHYSVTSVHGGHFDEQAAEPLYGAKSDWIKRSDHFAHFWKKSSFSNSHLSTTKCENELTFGTVQVLTLNEY